MLIDSSAWIEFLRDTRRPTRERVDQIVGARHGVGPGDRGRRRGRVTLS